MTQTQHPVVLIHGVFGYGRTTPFFNCWSPYWPENALKRLNPNHIIVEVGALSSDHDRACEAFYQLVGGRVDYGKAHAKEHGHLQYGATYTTPLYARWSAAHPIHLVGHSFGATTAIELYQLICQDAFGIGSNHTWVQSITCIAGPLTGTTLTHLFGLHEPKMVPYSLGHFIGSSLAMWYKLTLDFPRLRRIFDYRMPQWQHIESYWECLSPSGRLNRTSDLAVYDILPSVRIERNRQLQDMDKSFLVSITTSSHFKMPVVEVALVVAIVLLSLWLVCVESSSSTLFLIGLLSLILRHRLQTLDYATIPSLYWIMWAMKRRVRSLHQIFDEFEAALWEHNDGAVNCWSMWRPWFPFHHKEQADDEEEETASTGSSSPTPSPSSSPRSSKSYVGAPVMHEFLQDLYHQPTDQQTYERGTWYVHRVRKNHLASTHYDRDASELFRHLFQLIAQKFEQ